jgi:hypothetical protein
MRFFLIIVSVFWFAGCQVSHFSSFPSEKELNADKILKKVAIKVNQETGLIPFGSGGRMLDQIKMMHLAFVCHEPIDIEKARELVVKASDELLREINSDEKIRPYLGNYPFEPKNITIQIFIQKLDGHSFGGKELSVIHASDGIIQYEIESPDPYRLMNAFEETYEEALLRLKDVENKVDPAILKVS